MKKRMKSLMMSAIFAVCLFAGFAGFAGNIDATNKYSWSANSGWCNMESASGSVTVYDTYLSGYAWNENSGWIKLGSDAGGPYNNTNSTDWGVNNDENGNLSGYAWSANVGWINFSTAQSQVKIDTAGNFSGYAWNENTGWIHFANTGSATYKVKTSWSPSYTVTAASDGNGTVAPLTQTVKYDGTATAITATPSTNYRFVQWNDANEDNPRILTNITADTTITATFAIDTYTLTYTAGANGSITGISPQSVNNGSDGTLVTAVPDAHYHFVDWSDGVTTAARTDLSVTADISVTASFASTDLLYGSIIPNKASDVPNLKNEYTRRPRVFGTYIDPIKNKPTTRRSIANPITKIRPTGPSDFFDSEWRRRVKLFKKSDLRKANRKQKMTTADWLVANPISSIICKLYLRTKDNDNDIVDVNFTDMEIAPPTVTSIESWDEGGVLRGLHTKSIVVINGEDFGSKLPIVGFEYRNAKGQIKQQRLRVQRRYDYTNARGQANKSCMDVDTGLSKIYVEMPNKDYAPDTYSLILDNGVGIALDSGTGTLPEITFLNASDNTAPVATDDSEVIQVNIARYENIVFKYLFDVLANDTDLEADKLTLSLEDKTTALGGKVTVVNRKIKYALPKDVIFPFVDTFDYTINDGHNGSDTGTVTVTLNQLSVTSVTNWDGDALTTVQNNSIISIKGENFGVKEPVVSLKYTDANGVEKLKRLRVESQGKYSDYKNRANKSYTDLDTGESEVRVRMPKQWWSNWVSGKSYTLVVDNKKDSDETQTITAEEGNNTPPIANADSATLYSGSLYYYIDVLANDKDIHANKVKIVLPSSKSEKGGRVTFYKKTNQVKYIRPKNLIANFTDSFTYYLKDSNGEISETVTVDLSINLN